MTSIHRRRDAGCGPKMRQKAEEGRSVAVSNPLSTSFLLRRRPSNLEAIEQLKKFVLPGDGIKRENSAVRVRPNAARALNNYV